MKNHSKQRDKRPVILLTTDYLEHDQHATEHRYSIRANYSEAIVQAGGATLLVPHELEQLDTVFDLADGIVIAGSQPGVVVAERRAAFERALIGKALDAGKPLLGICHGMQMIGEHLGGQVSRDDPYLLRKECRHIPAQVPNVLAHGIKVHPDSQLHAWTRTTQADVNSLHRHVLEGNGLFRVTAQSDDGFVEAIEATGGSLCLGVQWHPEYRLTKFDQALMAGFVNSCCAIKDSKLSTMKAH